MNKNKETKRGDILTTEFQISLQAARINAGLTQAKVSISELWKEEKEIARLWNE